MVRDHKQSDIDDIIRIYTQEYKAMPEEIETLKSASKILVYDDDGVQGFIHLAKSGSFCYIEMGAAPDEKIRTIGLKLWKEAEKYFEENAISLIQVFHVRDNLHWEEFFHEIRFEYWYSVYRLTFEGQKFPEPDIRAIRYEDRYFEDKIRLESEAFSVVREKHDIKPFNWYLSAGKENLEYARKSTLDNSEYIYLFFEEDEMIGASMVKNAEIELLFTNIRHQGKGYGKMMLEYTVNRGLEQNDAGVSLNVLAGNEKALKLYKNAGFELVQGQDSRRLVIG